MDGVLRCTRYSFGPNRLHYCGPDANRELLAYLRENEDDMGLHYLLRAFRTMYPYLLLIARSNGIADPFDERVVEAYWLGNDLLENVGARRLYAHLADTLELKRKMRPGEFTDLAAKLADDVVPHHSFHVLDVWRRTGNHDIAHTLESMDECRISWGTVTAVAGPRIDVMTERLRRAGDRVVLGDPEPRSIRRDLESMFDIEQLAPGQTVSIHWGVPCEVIDERQTAALRKYTLRHLEVASLVS